MKIVYRNVYCFRLSCYFVGEIYFLKELIAEQIFTSLVSSIHFTGSLPYGRARTPIAQTCMLGLKWVDPDLALDLALWPQIAISFFLLLLIFVSLLVLWFLNRG
jgi:hypothetical protein